MLPHSAAPPRFRQFATDAGRLRLDFRRWLLVLTDFLQFLLWRHTPSSPASGAATSAATPPPFPAMADAQRPHCSGEAVTHDRGYRLSSVIFRATADLNGSTVAKRRASHVAAGPRCFS